MAAGQSPSAGLEPSAVLNRLDWRLGEIGRRQHRFAWLRQPSGGDWLAVDAYYPGNRVIVVISDDHEMLTLCEDLVPRHGFFLLTLAPEELAGDGGDLAKRLRARLEIQGWEARSDTTRGDPRPVPAMPAGPPPTPAPAQVMRMTPALDDYDVPPDVRVRTRPSPVAGAPRAARGGTRSTGASQSEGIGIGITLVVAVVLELVVGGGLIGLGSGQYVLGFGFVLDACARVLGMVAASQSHDTDAAWVAVIFGSPALWGLKDGAGHADIAPVARVTAVLAGAVVALGLVIWIA